MCNMTGVTDGAENVHPSGAPKVCVAQSIVFRFVFCFWTIAYFFVAIVLSVHLRITASTYSFWYLSAFLISFKICDPLEN